jgi:hypothetical protein
MLVIVMGVFALVAFVRLADAAREGKGGARAWVLIEAALIVPLAGMGLLVAMVLLGLTCDESCEDPPTDWRHSPHAWQWVVQFGVAMVGTVAVVSAFVAAWRANYRLASALMVLAAVSFGAWAAFLAPLGSGLGI